MPENILQAMTGTWEGNCRTWFFPPKLEDESKIKGSIHPILNGRLFRHEYTASMKGKPRHGEETLVLNGLGKRFQVSWFDSFHMNYGILFTAWGAGSLLSSVAQRLKALAVLHVETRHGAQQLVELVEVAVRVEERRPDEVLRAAVGPLHLQLVFLARVRLVGRQQPKLTIAGHRLRMPLIPIANHCNGLGMRRPGTKSPT